MKVHNRTDHPIVIRLESESGDQIQVINLEVREYQEITLEIPITSIDTIVIEEGYGKR